MTPCELILLDELKIYGNPFATLTILRLTGEHEQNVEDEFDLLKERILAQGREFCYIVVPVKDWTYEMTPWIYSALTMESTSTDATYGVDIKNVGSGAETKLDDILNMVIPRFESVYKKENRRYILAGYSLAGLFALWASYQTDRFWGIVAASPSVWYPFWIQYAEREQSKAQRVYLSLGSQEHKTRNMLMSSVADHIQIQYECLVKQKIDVTFERNPGNHFQDATERMVKGITNIVLSSQTSE